MAVIDTVVSPRTFWRYWTSSTASQLGDAVTEVAMPLVALRVLHATPFQVGLVAAASYAAWLFLGLPAGVIVSRLPLRATQVALDVARAIALVTIPVAAWLGVLTLAQLVIVAFLLNMATVVFSVANMTFLPSVVPKHELVARNSLMSATYSGTQLAGPSLGGVLVQAFGAATALLTDVVSYVVSAVTLAGLPQVAQTDNSQRQVRLRVEIREGWRFVTRHPVMGPCLIDASLVNFIFAGLLALVPTYLVRTLHASSTMVGLLIAGGGAGALVMAAAVPRLVSRFGSARASLGAGILGGLVALLMPLGHGAVAMLSFAVGYALYQGSVAVRSVNYFTHRQTEAPPELLPRVLATARFVSWGVMPFGALAAGAAASIASPRAALWLFALLTLVGPTYLLTTGVRRRRDLADA